MQNKLKPEPRLRLRLLLQAMRRWWHRSETRGHALLPPRSLQTFPSVSHHESKTTKRWNGICRQARSDTTRFQARNLKAIHPSIHRLLRRSSKT